MTLAGRGMTPAGRLPAFTWDRVAPLREKAGLHPDGPVDLSMGTPADPARCRPRRGRAGRYSGGHRSPDRWCLLRRTAECTEGGRVIRAKGCVMLLLVGHQP